ncbi:glutathione S-transferase omega-1-like [Gigantopelta aegis]|uniref:glutathione S-transferase omega-1-like n=1 Tax=Gigantopelta aegis TaxID=1735272 RepID=UPI001B888DAC|nr:glutathione S-transferase omega-1-like [Gigantopelta aegis]
MSARFEIPHRKEAYSRGYSFPPLKPGVLRLYSMRFCPYAQSTRLVLEHKQIPYETININLKYKPDWFLQRNPLGLAPVIEKDGKIVYESIVCNQYLDDVYPQSRLSPLDPYLKARDRILEEVFRKFIMQFHKLVFSLGKNKEAGKNLWKVAENFENALAERGHFFGGDKLCMLDCTVYPYFERLGMLEVIAPNFAFTEERFPNINAYVKRMQNVPAVMATMVDTVTHIQFGISLMQKQPKYDLGLAPSKANL